MILDISLKYNETLPYLPHPQKYLHCPCSCIHPYLHMTCTIQHLPPVQNCCDVRPCCMMVLDNEIFLSSSLLLFDRMSTRIAN